MNNNQKLVQTIEQTKKLQRKYKREVKQQIAEAESYPQRYGLEKKLLAIEELEFPYGKPYAIFCSVNYGGYRQYIRNRKKCVYAIPICFLLTLYEQELKAAFPEEEIQILYTLKGFWEMEKALELFKDFTKLQNRCQEVLLCDYRRLESDSKEKAEQYVKILDEFVSIRINSGWKKAISYKESQFLMHTTDVKLDVVPLCKILTKYYANVAVKINRYLKVNASEEEKNKLVNIEEDFRAFMERYFVNVR